MITTGLSNPSLKLLTILTAGLLWVGQTATAANITIDTVPVGFVGNPADSTGFGAVAYGYRIGTYEVTNAQYAAFLNAKAASDPLGLYNTDMGNGFSGITRSGSNGSYNYSTISGRENKPVNYVSWYDAIRFANWLHNGQGVGDTESGAYTILGGTATPSNGLSITRNVGATWWLTSEDEWYKAAYFVDTGSTAGAYSTYPTSSSSPPTAGSPPGGSSSANYGNVVGDLTDVGAYTASDSFYGTFDQGGNAWEWNESLIGGTERGARGGSFANSASRLSASFQFSEVPTHESQFFGFRVATVPEPSSLALAGLGAIGLLLLARRRRGVLGCLVAVSTTLLFAAPATAAPVSFTGLGDLPGTNFYSFAYGVSADGAVVVGRSNSASGTEAFRWTSGGGMVGLGDLPGGSSNSYAWGASADGAVVVGEGRSASGPEAFRWTSGGGMVGLGDLPGGSFFSLARDVSADGAVVVGLGRSASGPEAFRWTSGGGMVGLGDLPGAGFFSDAYGVSANGAVVVGLGSSASGTEAFRWTSGGGMVGLGDLPGGSFYSLARDVSADGAVVVGEGISASGFEAFRWTSGGGMVGLGDLPGGSFDSRAWDVSSDGSVVVGRGISASGFEAFLWDETNGMRSLQDVLTVDHGLDLTGWTLTEARGVSADGRTIVGYGTNPDGNTEAWAAVVPEPSSLALSGMALLALIGIGARRRKSLACLLLAACTVLLAIPATATPITIDTVPVGNLGNSADTTGYGAVSYRYNIGTTEVTNAQYAEFLNAKAASDPLGLYNTNMGTVGFRGGISRTGTSGSYTYSTISGRENMPVNWVSWYDSIRFANWLHNGQGIGDTETGAYTILGGTATPTGGLSITRNPAATWWLTSEDEWYKAAYHKNDGDTANYFDYPTSSDTAPTAEAPAGGLNSANYLFAVVGDYTDAGAYVDSDSPYGTFDQAGNVWEWNESLLFGSARGLRGGASTFFPNDLSALEPNLNFPTFENNEVGFRVATVPEPSSLVLAGLGAIGLLLFARRRRGLLTCLIAGTGTLLFTAPSHAGPASFTGLGDLPGGSSFSQAWGVSADGSVVVGYSSSASGSEAFRWTSGGGMVDLSDLPGGGFDSLAYGASADGTVVVGRSNSASGTEAFRWTSGGGMVGLGDLPGGSYYSAALGVSSDGSVVVGNSVSTSGTEAFRWTSGGGMVGLSDLPGGSSFSQAWGVSADGSVVVGYSGSTSGNEAFRWTSGGGMVGLGDLPGGGFDSLAYGVSSDGSTVVGNSSSASGTEAFRWTSGGGMVGLGDLPGGSFYSRAWDVSSDGSVVVGFSVSTIGTEAFLWDDISGMRSLQDVLTTDLGLDLTGWTLSDARGVSADGRTIVGYGTNPDGKIEAWVAVVPEPSSLALSGMALLALIGIGARRCKSLACLLITACTSVLVIPATAAPITIDTVPVGNLGNTADTTGFGAVSYTYNIGTTEVTNAQYAAFLNEKAKSDPLGLYNFSMGGGSGGITRSGSSGSYSYAAISGRENRAVNYVTWYDAIRFANWLHNGQGTGDTENGAYTILGGTATPSNGLSITRNPEAQWFLTSEDEWYKAAYHKNDGDTANYFEYPTSSDSAPTAEAPAGGSNSANYDFVVGYVTDAGAYVDSESPYGTFDQGGNVREWNEALIGSSSFRGLRGGSFVFPDLFLHADFRGSRIPANGDHDVGFRVATVPEPSSLALAGMGGIGLLLVARRRRDVLPRFLFHRSHPRSFLATVLALVCIGTSPGVAGIIVLDPHCSDGNAGNGIEGALLDPNLGCVAGDPAITAADYPVASLFSPGPITVPLGQDLVLDLTSLPSDFGLDVDFFLTNIGIAAPLGNFVSDAGLEGPGALTVSSTALTNIGITSTGTFDVHYLVTDLDSNNLGNQLGDISQFTLTVVEPVPEPSSLVLASFGTIGILLLARRKRGVLGCLIAANTALLLAAPANATPTTVPTDLNPGDKYHPVFVTSMARDVTSTNIA